MDKEMMEIEMRELSRQLCEQIGERNIADIGEITVEHKVYNTELIAELVYKKCEEGETGGFIWGIKALDTEILLIHIRQDITRVWNDDDGYIYHHKRPYMVNKNGVFANQRKINGGTK